MGSLDGRGRPGRLTKHTRRLRQSPKTRDNDPVASFGESSLDDVSTKPPDPDAKFVGALAACYETRLLFAAFASPDAREPMTLQHAERLCRELMRADSSDAAVVALRQARYWDDPKAWRSLGDNAGNLSIVANQQSDPVAALAEKLTNAVDARLINACWTAGANPEHPDGPNSPRAAVARFINRKSPEAEKYGSALGCRS